MAYLDLTAGGVTLPSPVEISIDNEILWSEDSGRTLSGEMIADVVAEKKALNITWGYLTETEFDAIKSYISSGFFTLTFTNISITAYRGTLSGVVAGYFGGTMYYKSATCKVVQK